MNAKAKDAERKPFKDWFDKTAARAMAEQMSTAMPDFDQAKFVKLASGGLQNLEFNGRVQQFSNALKQTLPESPVKALNVVKKSLPAPLPDCEAITDGWLQWPVGQFIADHGIEHFDASMKAMIALTQRFSSEYAVRPFVERYPEKIFEHFQKLTSHKSPHVRRWCSEGVRTRLPWGKKLNALIDDPSAIWPILEALKDDDEIYVRKSVANNINDIAKDHADAVVARLKKWQRGSNKNRDWVIKHGLRTLIKDGHAGALALSGLTPPEKLKATLDVKPKRVAVGESVTLSAILENDAAKTQQLLVDYVVHYVRKNKSTSGKVFKWKQIELAAKQSESLEKKLAMRETTVRALYPGKHKVELQINGERFAEAVFTLT